jgi:thymidylate synthase (FAD)
MEIKLLDNGYVNYIAHMGDDMMPLQAARMSTGNPTGLDTDKDEKLRSYLWKHGHATPFEMSVLQVEVQCPIFVAREWMRHRTFSYNEFSGRYAEMPDLYYLPDSSRMVKQSDSNKQMSGEQISETDSVILRGYMRQANKSARATYEHLLSMGVAREVARCVLPVSQYTRFRAQANLRNWLHFLNLRMADNAQYEIRVYANAVAEIVEHLWPNTWQVFKTHTLKG